MQYVGKLVSTVYNTITPNINPATLSGAIDVIVVERKIDVEEELEVDVQGNVVPEAERGRLPEEQRRYSKVRRQKIELASTPFHVRFGKMSVLRPAERKVTLHLNNATEPLPFAMKVGEAGEAFFVLEIDDEDELNRIPADLVTSPILSAASSPIGGEPIDDKAAKSSEVEPLDLGESRADVDSAAGSADRNSRQKLRENKESGEPDDAGDLNVPGDSTKTGSGAAAGSDSLLDRVGSAASKASGVIGAAGRAVMGTSGNPRLDKAADRVQRSEPTDIQTGTAVDEDRGDAHEYEPEQGGPEGKKRQQRQEDAPHSGEKPMTETERLEKQIRERAFAVIQDEIDVSADGAGAQAEVDSSEEAYPAPFGLEAHKRDKLSKTASVDSIRHSEYLDGKHLKPIPIGKNGKTLDPAMTDASTHIHLHEQRKQKRRDTHSANDTREAGTKAGKETAHEDQHDHDADEDDDDTAVDDDDDDDIADPAEIAVKVKKPKEDLQYMLDMDGYKMTADGEDLAYQEGHRFADEMPLGKRHGGKGRHGHPERLNGPGHQHKVSLPGVSSASMRRGSGSRTHRPTFSVDERKRRSSHSQTREQLVRRESLDDSVDSSLSSFPSNDELNLKGGKRDELELSRDLARLARMNRPSELAESRSRTRPRHRALEVTGQSLRRHSSLSNRQRESNSASTSGSNSASASGSGAVRAGRRRAAGRGSRHIGEFSLSDTEAEVPRSKTASGRSSVENSIDGLPSSFSVSDIVPSLRDLKMPSSEEATPVVVDDASAAHLGLSSDLRWQWGDPSHASAASTPGGTSSSSIGHRRHTRFASTDGLEVSRSSDMAALEALRRQSTEGDVSGKLQCSDSEPYTFRLELEDSSHSFELSLCYNESFGEDPDSDEYNFAENRVSFQRFVHDEEVVNDERLVIRYHDRFLTWENASAVLATLSLYRRTLSTPSIDGKGATGGDEDEAITRSSRASYWSRWWKRSSKSIPDLKQVSQAQEEQHQSNVEDEQQRSGHSTPSGIGRSNTDSILDTDLPSPSKMDSANSAAQLAAARGSQKTYAKTLRLTSDQLKSLHLRKGANTITFSVTSSYSGVATCTARIFLWESSHKIVVSDIDGTITKSDALGHVFTMIGRDWTHIGVAKLYTDIARNGYRIMYLTSRAIGQADSTRDYLKGIRQNGYQLPDGPVIMSPDRLIASLHREVILRKPEVFKMACLRDIARLFGADPRTAHAQPGGNLKQIDPEALQQAEKGAGAENSPGSGAATAAPMSPSAKSATPSSDRAGSPASGGSTPRASSPTSPGLAAIDAATGSQERSKAEQGKEEHPTPFYAGFGNRITDALSYRSVNIPSSRIFTIDTNGEVKMELLELAGYKSSYIHMTDLVDQMFPPITAAEEKAPRKPEFNDFNYWRPAIVDVELPPDDELLGTPPVSPALSARSGRSMRSVRSATSDGGVGSGGGGPGGNNAGTEEKPGRLSRFGLGSLGLSRKASASTTGLAKPEHAATVGPELTSADLLDRKQRASSAEPSLMSSNGSGNRDSDSLSLSSSPSTSSWTAPWRRRAASPDDPGRSTAARATSPLVGPVITAEPESEDEGQEFYDSEGMDDDDDVSSFGGAGSRSRLASFDDDDDGDSGRRSNLRARRSAVDDVDDIDEDDPLLETGEIRFEWKG
ncbi:LNS2-domain-containing protein [Testicularia cyperi]|uniref:phosphatidate phosphatase n=1 Tax=Testicularia cyperi TaxID=1882483 RepID=A0A317XIS1_9BASI|nr:LNS2-domain-containing protein [Testicularia cyperi]